MRIVLMFEAFSKNMGYLGNMLPKYLARLGADVHVVTTDLPFYYSLPDFKQTYDTFIQSNSLSPGSVEKYDGYILHILPHKKVLGYVQMIGWLEKLKEIKPDIVQAFPTIGWVPLNAALAKSVLKYKLFTGNHTSASTFPLYYKHLSIFNRELIKCFIARTIPGRIVSLATEKCYCATIDCAEIAWRFFGVQKQKVEVMHLGVDTDFFFPITSSSLSQERIALREKLGIPNDEIVCIYTGKLTETKNAILLAQAVQKLRDKGKNFMALFIGDGVQKEDIQRYPFCKVLSFMPYFELGVYYRASDIAVWPTNESTSMLDATACGLPLIVSDGIVYRDHVEGNGLVYKMNNLDDLVNNLLSLSDDKYRKELGDFGANKMAIHFSWETLAKQRLNDYNLAL
jgi:glycosyltransferase involved in cell wall biosynthesis